MRDTATSSPPFEVKAIDHVLLVVDGLERSLDFYEAVLGARVESRLPRYGMVELSAGDSHIDLVDASAEEGAWARPDGSGRNLHHVALRLSACDADAARRHLAAHGVEIAEERIEEGTNGKSISLYVHDPSGNTIELMGLSGL
jgi:glyoxylase I family protein